MDIFCSVCGTAFTPKDREQRLCSWKCRGKWAAMRRPERQPYTRPCSKCGTPILTKGRSLTYCDDCRLLPAKVCPVCGVTFHKRNRTFCSGHCRAVEANRKAPTGAAHWNYKGVNQPYGTHEWFIARDTARTRDGWTCQDCGRQRPEVRLHAHHLVSRADWGDRPGTADDPINLVTVCTACHKRRHALPKEVVRERSRARSKAWYQKRKAAASA